MSVLDGKQVVSLNGVNYTLQNPPHAAAPWAQNAAFNAAVASELTSFVRPSVLTASTVSYTAAQFPASSILVFTGTTSSQSATLPPVVSGQLYIVVNGGSVAWKVITPTGQFNLNSTNAITLAAGATAFIAVGISNFVVVSSTGTIT